MPRDYDASKYAVAVSVAAMGYEGIRVDAILVTVKQLTDVDIDLEGMEFSSIKSFAEHIGGGEQNICVTISHTNDELLLCIVRLC